jgi:hypothetical protein
MTKSMRSPGETTMTGAVYGFSSRPPPVPIWVTGEPSESRRMKMRRLLELTSLNRYLRPSTFM